MSSHRIKVLVAGGAGFLGSHLCEQLLELGHEVYCLDNFFTGTRNNIAHLESHEHFTLIEHDICMSLDLNVKQIYNLACPASPKHYQKDPVYTLRTCVLGSFNLLELARKNSARILQASTSEVYGDPSVHPQPETYCGSVNPIGPRACYDEGKRCAETLFFDSKRMHGLDCKIARIFNTYGPRMQEDDGRVISNFILQALQGKPLTVYGNGEQTRSFCYVDDLITGLILLMDSRETGPFNLGNPEEFTMKQLAELVLEKTKSQSPIAYTPLPIDDPKMRCPIITQAKEKLHWSPQVSLDEGLAKTIAYFTHKAKEPVH